DRSDEQSLRDSSERTRRTISPRLPAWLCAADRSRATNAAADKALAERPRPPISRSSPDRERGILFDDGAREGWIIHPQRSAYDFPMVRPSLTQNVIVERHP